MNAASVRIRRLSAALAVLLASTAFAWFAARAGRMAPEFRLLEASAADVSRIEIRDRGAQVVLERQGAGWVLIDGTLRLPARPARVEALLAELESRRRLDEAARTESARARLGLAEGAGRMLLLDASGAPLLDLKIGNFGPDGTSLFVAREGNPLSWSTDRAFASYLDTDRGRWLELALGGADARAEDASAIEVRGALTLDSAAGERFEADYRIARDPDGTWLVERGPRAALDQGRVDTLVRMVLGLEADDIVGVADSRAFESELSLSLVVLGSRREWRIRGVPGGLEIEASGLPWRYKASAARLRSALAAPEALFGS